MTSKSLFKRIILLLMGMFAFAYSTFAQTPYNIVMNIYDDPKTTMAFNWFTTSNTTGEQVEISIGTSTFIPFKTVTVNATTPQNVHKAVVTGLTPNTTYSFRVGKAGLWSNIGTFTTAKATKEPFSFIYITDTQIEWYQFDTLKMRTDMVATKYPNANFWMHCGDMIWNGYDITEWNKFFTSQQDMFYRFPFAPIQGNHEEKNSFSFKRHFNLDSTIYDPHKSTYTYIYGDVLFFAINSELWDNSNYITALSTWIRNEVNAHADITWRIVYFHRSTYTAAGNLQNDVPTTQWRQTITPLFDELNIDLVLFGHDHVYQVIGPVKNKQLVQGSVSNVDSVTPTPPYNATGKSGGTFNVKEGTLYFCNGTFGTHLFYPMPFGSMPGINTDIPDYPSLFTGMLGQNGNPTYSNVSVSTGKIIITTHEIVSGNSQLLDEIKIIKYCDPNTQDEITYNSSQDFNNVTLSIGETLRIKNNATVIFTNSTLRFYKHAKVIIEPGSRLVLNGCILTNSCPDKMWDGIHVGGNIGLPQTSQNQGVIELKNGTLIENAKEAISTYTFCPNGNTDWDSFGGIIKADDAIFKNNRRAVEFMTYTTANNASYFNNCTFVVVNNNLFATNNAPFVAHITMWQVRGVKIRNCTFENNMTSIPDRGKAIRTIDADYIVEKHCPLINQQTCECANNPKPSKFIGFNSAIWSSNTGTQYAIQIDRSDFQENVTGISMFGQSDLQITRSNILLNASNATGIYLNSCTGYKVEENTISNGSSSTTGIWIHNAGNNENVIYRNEIFGSGYGIQVTSPLDERKISAFPATGLQFVCNNLNSNLYDILVSSPGKIRTSQGSAAKGADNRFSPNPATSGNFNVAQPLNYHYSNWDPRMKPVHKTSNITLDSTAAANSCQTTLCNTNGGTKGFEHAESLEEYRGLNNKLTKMMHLFYEKGYDKVLTDYYNGIIEDEKLLQEAIAYHEEVLAVTQYMAEISRIALFSLKTDSILDLTKIRDWYEEINLSSAKYSLAETYYQLEKFEEGLKTLDLIPKMFNLSEEEMVEHHNYVSLFTFKNGIRESGRTIAQLKEEEIERMLHFAKASHGLSSVMARGVLCFFYEICLEEVGGLRYEVGGDEGEKEKGEKEKARKHEGTKGEKGNINPQILNLIQDVSSASSACQKTALENITLIPNPTTGVIEIAGLLNSIQYRNDIRSIEVFDVYGRSVLSHTSHLTPHTVLNISHLQSGIYFVKIVTEQGEIVKKVVKQ